MAGVLSRPVDDPVLASKKPPGILSRIAAMPNPGYLVSQGVDRITTPGYPVDDALRGYMGSAPAFQPTLGQAASAWRDEGLGQSSEFLTALQRGDMDAVMNSSLFPMGAMTVLKGKGLADSLDGLVSKWRDSGVDLSAYSSQSKPGAITLSKIVVPKSQRGQGVGTAAMDDLVKYADEHGKTIELSPSTDFGASSVSRLKGFYKRFGFVENKGRSKDFATRETMYRAPSADKVSGMGIKKVVPSKESLREVADSNFSMGIPSGDKTLNIDSLKGGMSSDATDAKKVKDLVKKMSGGDGYIERLIVDQNGNVLEGQHRLNALRAMGVKDVPVSVIADHSATYDALVSGGLRPEHARNIIDNVSELLEASGSAAKVRADYEFPKGYESAFNTALDRMAQG